jgi:hypothetical protein
VRYREEDLQRAFFSSRFTRKLDLLGYARFRHWRLYGEEALAGNEAALWLEPETLQRIAVMMASQLRSADLPA